MAYNNICEVLDMIYTCNRCGREFESTSYHVLYCRDCRIKNRQDVAHNYYKKHKIPQTSYERTCPICGVAFKTTRSTQVYDCTECYQKAYYLKVAKSKAGAPQTTRIRISTETAKMLTEYMTAHDYDTSDAAIQALLDGKA